MVSGKVITGITMVKGVDQRGYGKRACGVFTRGKVARFGVCVVLLTRSVPV